MYHVEKHPIDGKWFSTPCLHFLVTPLTGSARDSQAFHPLEKGLFLGERDPVSPISDRHARPIFLPLHPDSKPAGALLCAGRKPSTARRSSGAIACGSCAFQARASTASPAATSPWIRRRRPYGYPGRQSPAPGARPALPFPVQEVFGPRGDGLAAARGRYGSNWRGPFPHARATIASPRRAPSAAEG